MEKPHKNIVIAAGGTGGHLFPAQALARDLQNKGYSIVFMGKGLSSTRFFYRHLFAYKEVTSSSCSWKRPFTFFSLLLKGTYEAWHFLKERQPELVIGFGSFHAFPVLAAAFLRRIPIALFESNSVPGRVNRLFSKYAVFSAVQFFSAKKDLKGTSIEVSMPFWRSLGDRDYSKQELASYFLLDPDCYTFLVFGGSQGSQSINVCVLQAFQGLLPSLFQVIHITGTEETVQEIRDFYRNLGIKACVKSFEDQMHFAWLLADVAICRAGAATLSELVLFEVPSILIPYPQASEQHQLKNALFMAEEVKGAFCLPQKNLLPNTLLDLMLKAQESSLSMRTAISYFKKHRHVDSLVNLVEEFIEGSCKK